MLRKVCMAGRLTVLKRKEIISLPVSFHQGFSNERVLLRYCVSMSRRAGAKLTRCVQKKTNPPPPLIRI